jgi:hypothetical protein
MGGWRRVVCSAPVPCIQASPDVGMSTSGVKKLRRKIQKFVHKCKD